MTQESCRKKPKQKSVPWAHGVSQRNNELIPILKLQMQYRNICVVALLVYKLGLHIDSLTLQNLYSATENLKTIMVGFLLLAGAILFKSFQERER